MSWYLFHSVSKKRSVHSEHEKPWVRGMTSSFTMHRDLPDLTDLSFSASWNSVGCPACYCDRWSSKTTARWTRPADNSPGPWFWSWAVAHRWPPMRKHVEVEGSWGIGEGWIWILCKPVCMIWYMMICDMRYVIYYVYIIYILYICIHILYVYKFYNINVANTHENLTKKN